MNQDTHVSREKQEAFRALVEAIRVSQNASDIMDEAFAALLGINRTDGRCLDIVQRLGQITAGELAQHSGLTTGAVTTVIDRLSAAGYVRRVADPNDRRKVLVELTDLAKQLGEIVFGEIWEISSEGMMGMTPENMQLVTRFLRTSSAMNVALSGILREVVPEPMSDSGARLHQAKEFAKDITRRRGDLTDHMSAAWNGADPDINSEQC